MRCAIILLASTYYFLHVLIPNHRLEDFVSFYPKCYFADKTMIVMEDLGLERGFVMLKREERQDLEEAMYGLLLYSHFQKMHFT